MKITEIQETPDSKKRRWPRVNGREIPWTPEQIKWFEKFGLANGVFYDKKNEAEITNPRSKYFYISDKNGDLCTAPPLENFIFKHVTNNNIPNFKFGPVKNLKLIECSFSKFDWLPDEIDSFRIENSPHMNCFKGLAKGRTTRNIRLASVLEVENGFLDFYQCTKKMMATNTDENSTTRKIVRIFNSFKANQRDIFDFQDELISKGYEAFM
jgi:hypothetical protein